MHLEKTIVQLSGILDIIISIFVSFFSVLSLSNASELIDSVIVGTRIVSVMLLRMIYSICRPNIY